MRLPQDKPGRVALSECSGKLYVLVSEAREEDFAKLLHFMKTSSGVSSWQFPEGLLSCLVRFLGGGSKFRLPACFPLPEEPDICGRPNWRNLLAVSAQLASGETEAQY